MGYYTHHALTVLNDKLDEIDSSIVPEFEKYELDAGTVQEYIENSADSSKWYSHEKDMLFLSQKFPEYVFILDGDGEGTLDVWREFYKNGKTYKWEHPKISRPDFDLDKLK